jgi:4-oxalocrotonate tautomerase family enzyme
MPPAAEPPTGSLCGLLLDIGGVVHSTAMHLVGRLAETEPAMRPVLEQIGGLASDRDELWQRMLRRQVTERQYWAQRAAEFGAAVGQTWDTQAMMHRLYELPQQDWLRAEMVDLMTEAKAAGLRLGALTNDMTAFHGPGWASTPPGPCSGCHPGSRATTTKGAGMPLVRIDIMEGRPPEKIRELHSRVAALVAEILDTPIERVRTYITQFPPEGWGIGGVPADVARADEVATRRAATAQRAGT